MTDAQPSTQITSQRITFRTVPNPTEPIRTMIFPPEALARLRCGSVAPPNSGTEKEVIGGNRNQTEVNGSDPSHPLLPRRSFSEDGEPGEGCIEAPLPPRTFGPWHPLPTAWGEGKERQGD